MSNSPVTSIEKPVNQSTIVGVASVDKPVNMDPGYAQLYSSLQIYQNVFNKLVYVDETGQFIPGLAKSWKISDDGLVYTFELDPKATYLDLPIAPPQAMTK